MRISTGRPVATKTQNPNKNEDPERARGDLLRDLPESLEEFTENLVEERVPAHRDAPASSSRESAKVVLVSTVLKLTSRKTRIATYGKGQR